MSLHHSAKLTPGIRPLTAATPALGKSRYRLILSRIYETIRKMRILTRS